MRQRNLKTKPLLQYIDLPLVTDNHCKTFWDDLQSNQICAYWKDHKQDACQGDSGGPMACDSHKGDHGQYALIGVTSFGNGCGNNWPGVYTRISSYLDWIKNLAGEVQVLDAD